MLGLGEHCANMAKDYISMRRGMVLRMDVQSYSYIEWFLVSMKMVQQFEGLHERPKYD